MIVSDYCDLERKEVAPLTGTARMCVNLGSGFPLGESAPERRLSRKAARSWLQEPEVRDLLTDRQLAVVTLWTRDNPVATIAVALKVSRRAADKSLRLGLAKMAEFSVLASRG